MKNTINLYVLHGQAAHRPSKDINSPCGGGKGAINTFERVKDVTIPEFVKYDSPLPVSASTELGYATIGKVGGRLNLPLDQCKLLGKEILRKKLPLIFNRTGQAFDYSYMYNSLKAFCLENKSECVTRIPAVPSIR